MTDLGIVYEHPQWFLPLFAALDRRGVDYQAYSLVDHNFDLAEAAPAPLIFNRVAQSGFLRHAEHSTFYTIALLDHWARSGARMINGSDVLQLDSSKARQLSLVAALGLGVPGTRVVHRPADLLEAAETMDYPLLVKANIGGSGAGIARYNSRQDLAQAIGDGSVPQSIDKVLLLQDYVPARGDKITRIETLAGKFLYALDVETGNDVFDLCPADACVAQPGRAATTMTATVPPPEIVAAAERIAQAAGLDVGGIEVVIDDRDGVPRFYDINAMSNFVADPVTVLGWDPHDRLVDYLEQRISE
ncbi:MAG: alpha-L-glutamate ligase [Sphingomicrobium sp.]